MKLSNKRIKNLIHESLRRILFESEGRIEDLKDQFNLIYQKMSRAKTQEEFNRLNAEAERLDKEINRLTRTMFKEPEEPGEFDFMQSDPIDYPVPYQSGEVTGYEEDPLDRPARIDVTDGAGNEYSGGPMTQRDMNRREFAQNLGVGIGASALLGKQILDSDSLFADPRLQIASDWFDQSFADGTWDAMYNTSVKNWLENTTRNLEKDFDSLSDDEQLSYIIDYLMDYSPEDIGYRLVSEFENAGYQDPGETGEMDVYNQLSDLIYKKLSDYYTPSKIKQLRSAGTTKTTILTNDMIEEAIEVTDNHFDYNGATDVISNGTLDDIESFEQSQTVQMMNKYLEFRYAETGTGVSLSPQDSRKLLLKIRSKIDKIMSRLGGP